MQEVISDCDIKTIHVTIVSNIKMCVLVLIYRMKYGWEIEMLGKSIKIPPYVANSKGVIGNIWWLFRW